MLPKEAYCPPELRKHTLSHSRLAEIQKRPRPFLIFRKFDILKLCLKVGMLGTKRSVLTCWARNNTYWSSQIYKIRTNGKSVKNCAVWQKEFFFQKLFYTTLVGYQTKLIVPLSSEDTLLTTPDMSYALEEKKSWYLNRILPDIMSDSSKTRIRYFSGPVWSVPIMSKSLTGSGAALCFLKA